MRILDRLALGRRELLAWALYDWANSAFITTIVAAVFPIYFSHVAQAGGLTENQATQRFTVATIVALTIVALMAPVLGAIADFAPVKKKLLGAFLALGATSTAALALVGDGDWVLGAILFGLGNIGAMSSFVMYDSLLPHIARPGELDRVSTAGYALGYVGGGILLLVNLTMIQKPELFGLADAGAATRVSFITVAIWWLVFSIPLLRRVPEPAVRLARPPGTGIVRAAFSGLGQTFRELRKYKQATLFLVAFLIYNDGIGTIIKLATIYGTEIGIDAGTLIKALLLVQFIGIPFAFVFGQLADKIGTRRSIFIGLAVYGLVSVVGYFMKTATHFYLLAVLVGVVQGGTQALSRSLFASMIPRAKSSEFFGLFAVFEKFAGVAGPALFALINLFSDSSRPAILSLVAFFAVGALLLAKVDVAEGQRIAAEANARDGS